MIAVIGDIMIDEYIYGSSSRTSPECNSAPVVVVIDRKIFIGGAGNTALNIHYLDSEVMLFTSCESRGRTQNLLSAYDIDYKLSVNSAIDIVKTRVYSNGIYIARLDLEEPVVHDEKALVDKLFLQEPDLIVISDYGKSTIVKPEEIINKAKSLGIKVLVDTKNDLYKYKGAYLIKPNLKEFLEWAGLDVVQDQIENVNKLTHTILKSALNSLQVEHLVITLGDMGCIHVDEYEVKMYPALPNKAIDVTGAGDSFIAGLAVALQEGKGIKRSIQFANRVASIAVTKKGTHYVTRNEI